MEVVVKDILLGLGALLVGGGGVWTRSYLMNRNGNSKFAEKSEKTGGAKRISEEGLNKLNEVKKDLDTKLSKEDHTLMCENAQLKMENTVRTTIQEELREFKRDLPKDEMG